MKKEEEKWFDTYLKEVKQTSRKHKQVILMRFFQDKTQVEVARIIGLSQVRFLE